MAPTSCPRFLSGRLVGKAVTGSFQGFFLELENNRALELMERRSAKAKNVASNYLDLEAQDQESVLLWLKEISKSGEKLSL